MIKLFSEEEFKLASYKHNFNLICNQCEKTFTLTKKEIKRALNPKNKTKGCFCSRECKALRSKRALDVLCKKCNKSFKKLPSEVKKSPNHFCSKSCAGFYNQTHKTKGNRRSKLESFLESQLSLLFPNLNILYNEKSTINSELDIFIPSLNLAFELNGIFHYEPIFGSDKLNSIQNNDNRKIQACLEKNIELCIIDVSSLKYFKTDNAKRFLDIITSIIEKKLDLLSTT